MANCNETLRELDAFLDGELSDETQRHIHAHLEHCVDCHQAFDFHAELKLAIQRKCRTDALPTGLMARIETCFNQDFDGDGVIGPA